MGWFACGIACIGICGCGQPAAHPDGAPEPDASYVPALLSSTVMSKDNASIMDYNVTTPGGVRSLVVSVQIGGECTGAAVPEVQGVFFNGPLQRIAAISGTPCGASSARSELWLSPDHATPVGTGTVEIQLSGPVKTIHSGAFVVSNISDVTPVRAVMVDNGAGASSSLAVASEPGDLVLDVVGQSTGIAGTAGGQPPAYIHDVDAADTLDNTAAAGRLATGSSAAFGWTFTGSGDWQEIAVSLRPFP